MSGYKIVLPTTFTNKSLPILGDDPVLNVGSLLLVEPGHPTSTYRGALADGDKLDNIAWRQAQALAGGTQETLKSRFERGSNAKAWWSAKGNSIQWVGGGADVDRVGAHFPLPVLNYLRANPSHVYRAILWSGLAEGTTGVNGRWSNVNFDLADATSSFFYEATGNAPGNLDASGNSIANTNTGTGHRRTTVGTGPTGYTGPITATAAQADVWSRLFGNIQNNRGPGSGQAIFHRFYMEDLTVSGRTAAQVDEADKAIYVAQMLKSGGRHYGESYAAKA